MQALTGWLAACSLLDVMMVLYEERPDWIILPLLTNPVPEEVVSILLCECLSLLTGTPSSSSLSGAIRPASPQAHLPLQ
jgi:hypothetical protein